MAASFVEKDNEIPSGPSSTFSRQRKSPTSSRPVDFSDAPASLDQNVEQQRPRKRPLHSDSACRPSGPPRARWKHEHPNRQGEKNHWRGECKKAPAGRKHGYERDSNDYRKRERDQPSGSPNDPWREPSDRTQYATSRHCQSRKSDERASNVNRYNSSSRDSTHTSEARRRDRLSRSSSSHRSTYDSQQRHSRSSSLPSSRSSSKERGGWRNRDPRAKTGHPLFTPANNVSKRQAVVQNQKTNVEGLQRRSSTPLKKRWVPAPTARASVSGTTDGQGQTGNEDKGTKHTTPCTGVHEKAQKKDISDGGEASNEAMGAHHETEENVNDSGQRKEAENVSKLVTEPEGTSLGETVETTGTTQTISGCDMGSPPLNGTTNTPQDVSSHGTADGSRDTKKKGPYELSKEAPLVSDAKTNKVDVEATPDLTEASSEECHRDLDTGSKAGVVAVPTTKSGLAPAAVVSESPHSLNHAEEESTLRVASGHVVNKDDQVGGNGSVPAATNTATSATMQKIKEQDSTQVRGGDEPMQNEFVNKEEKQEHVTRIDVKDAESSNDDTSSSEDEEEILRWAQKMFGVTPPGLLKYENANASESSSDSSSSGGDLDSDFWSDSDVSSLSDAGGDAKKRVPPRFKRKNKSPTKRGPGRPRKKQTKTPPVIKRKRGRPPKSKKRVRLTVARKKNPTKKEKEAASQAELEKERLAAEDAKRVKAEAKPPTPAELKAIFANDNDIVIPSSHWVRRSVRQPSKSVLTAPNTRSLLEKLRVNDGDMVVLKMKKYLSDPDTPTVAIDAALDALEENTNCQALYIQNFNTGMRDEQVLHLLRVLQLPSCRIWCLNVGETYNVKPKTWKAFADGLKNTKVTHMYASEHTISASQKEQIRDTIRKNRQKHNMHNNPDNLDVIIQCTHCWWNPVNAKSLRPYLQKRGVEYILYDKEKQGLRGSSSAAPTGNCETTK